MNLLDAIVYIANKNLIHGDIKPGNILVSNRDGRLRAFVGDFGLTTKSGGTPIFMAPEGLNKDFRIVGKTDLYSFAVTVLFLMLPIDFALKLLFIPIGNNRDSLVEILSRFPLLFRIFVSLSSDPEERPDIASFNDLIGEIRKFDENWLKSKITTEILEENGIDLQLFTKGCENEGVLYFFILDYFGYDVRSSRVNENEAYEISTTISQIGNLSSLQSKAQFTPISKGYFLILALIISSINSNFSYSRSRIRKCLLGLRYFDNAPRFDPIRLQKI